MNLRVQQLHRTFLFLCDMLSDAMFDNMTRIRKRSQHGLLEKTDAIETARSSADYLDNWFSGV